MRCDSANRYDSCEMVYESLSEFARHAPDMIADNWDAGSVRKHEMIPGQYRVTWNRLTKLPIPSGVHVGNLNESFGHLAATSQQDQATEGIKGV